MILKMMKKTYKKIKKKAKIKNYDDIGRYTIESLNHYELLNKYTIEELKDKLWDPDTKKVEIKDIVIEKHILLNLIVMFYIMKLLKIMMDLHH